MKLFTSRFVKDLFLIALFGIALYALTHNPMTHPKLEDVEGVWSIQLMQQPLVFGVAGHNYLVLRDSNNKIIEEFHGLATDRQTGEWKYIGNKETDTLQVWEFPGPHFYISQKNFIGKVLYSGNEQLVMSIWNKALTCKEDINNMNIPYPPYGVNMKGDTENSNSVAYTLALCMGLDVSGEHLGLITPGWGNDLLGTINPRN
jgi:hypothetical protein